jgi:hypothetical protein
MPSIRCGTVPFKAVDGTWNDFSLISEALVVPPAKN